MKTDNAQTCSVPPAGQQDKSYYRFHQQHNHLAPVFGNDWLALKAEAFARFFGTPVFSCYLDGNRIGMDRIERVRLDQV